MSHKSHDLRLSKNSDNRRYGGLTKNKQISVESVNSVNGKSKYDLYISEEIEYEW